MSDKYTKAMVQPYIQQLQPMGFGTGFFQAPPENFFDTHSIEFDVMRDDEQVAVAVQDLCTGYRWNSADDYTNKEFVPPVFREAFALESCDLLTRTVGDNPFENPGFRAKLTKRAVTNGRKTSNKIARAVESQAWEVLTTGKLDLKDSAGNTVYAIDFKAKPTHFADVANPWGGGSEDIIGDILTACNLVRNDAKMEPNQIIMGEAALEAALQNDEFVKRFDIRSIDLGLIAGNAPAGNGGNFRGVIEVGNKKLDLWTYDATYKDIQSGNTVTYMPTDKFIVRNGSARMDAFFGGVPHAGRALGVARNLLPELPTRLSSDQARMDLHINTWLTEDGETLKVGYSARPILVPTAIDSFACFDTLASTV